MSDEVKLGYYRNKNGDLRWIGFMYPNWVGASFPYRGAYLNDHGWIANSWSKGNIKQWTYLGTELPKEEEEDGLQQKNIELLEEIKKVKDERDTLRKMVKSIMSIRCPSDNEGD